MVTGTELEISSDVQHPHFHKLWTIP